LILFTQRKDDLTPYYGNHGIFQNLFKTTLENTEDEDKANCASILSSCSLPFSGKPRAGAFKQNTVTTIDKCVLFGYSYE